MEIGVRLYAYGDSVDSGQTYCTQVYVVVDYTHGGSSNPDQPLIRSPKNNTGTIYNTRPFIVITANGGGCYLINDCRIQIDNNNDFFSVEYARQASPSYYSEFSNIGVSQTPTIRHRVQTAALSAGPWYLRAMVCNNDTSVDGTARQSDWSSTVQFSITSPTWSQDDPTVTSVTTLIKASHFNEIKTRIDNLRLIRGSGAGSWTGWPVAATTGLIIKVGNLNELRTNMVSPFNEATGTDPVYTIDNGTLFSGTPVKASHINELRSKAVLP